MSAVTQEQQAELKKLAHRANQRLRSASEGQRAFAEAYMKKYYGFSKFSERKATDDVDYNKRMRQLTSFLGAGSSTKKGWMQQTQKAVERAAATLRDTKHYDLTDDEVANVLEELDADRKDEYYKVLDLVQASKYASEADGEEFDLSKAIKKALKSKMSDRDAINKKLAEKKRKEHKRSKKQIKKKKQQKMAEKQQRKAGSKKAKSNKKRK